MTVIQAKKEFLEHCKFEKNLSPKTISSYTIDLLQFARFLNENNCSGNLEEMSKKQIKEYLSVISYLKPKTIKRKIATLKALFNFLEVEDIICQNPFRKLKIRIKESSYLPVVMDKNEVSSVLKKCYSKLKEGDLSGCQLFEAYRDIVVIELLFATGARVSEISNLKDIQINTESGDIKIFGKGSKERIVQVCNCESLKILTTYKRLFQIRIDKSGGYFLVNRFGKKLSDQSIRAIVKKVTDLAGIRKKITPHKFRHTVATLLLENEVDLKYIQSILGHSSIATTQVYTHVSKEKQRLQILKRHPRQEFTMMI